MKFSPKFLQTRTANICIGIALSIVWMLFVYRHVEAFFVTAQWALLVFAFSETLQALLFLFRKIPKTLSLEPLDWLVGVCGTMVPFFFIPGGYVLLPQGQYLVYLAVLVQIAGLISLNRSFAIVAANRGVKTSGLYGIVRHPMYAGYIPLFLGYYLLNTSLMNVAILILCYGFMFMRIHAEERILLQDAEYQEYARRVKWRLIPFVY